MINKLKVLVNTYWFLLVLATLSACGGGGSSGASAPSFVVSVNQSSVAFSFQQGKTSGVVPQILNATWTGTPPAQVFVAATADAAGIDPAIAVAISQSSATITIWPQLTLPAGNYSGHINLFVCADQACNQKIGGTPISINFSVTVTEPVFYGSNFISLNYVAGTPLPAKVPLTVSASAGNWVATASQPWIVLSSLQGVGSQVVNVGIDPTKLTAACNCTGTITITGANGSQSSTVSLALSLPTLNISSPSINDVGVFGAPIAARNISVSLSGGAVMSLSVTANRSWIVLSGVSPTAPGTFSAVSTPAIGPLTPGSFSGSIHVQATDGHFIIAQDIPVSLLQNAPTLSVPAIAIVGGTNGQVMSSVPINLNVDTGTNAYPWTLTLSDAQSIGWLKSDVSSGIVSGTQPVTANVNFDRSKVTAGTYPGTARFDVAIYGSVFSASIPVTLNFESFRLVPEYDGIALSKFPSRQLLTRQIKIADGRDRANIPWSAQSNQAWLHVDTPAGTTGGSVQITADPTGLANDTLHEAVVTLSSTDSLIERSETIRVGVWIGSADPTNVLSTQISGQPTELIVNPVAPLVYYAIYGTGAIRVFNLYTGTIENTFNPSGIQNATAMDVSSDGRLLFVCDFITGTTAVLDASTGASIATYPQFNSSRAYTHTMVSSRPNGRRVLMTAVGEAFDVETHTRLRMFDSTGEWTGYGWSTAQRYVTPDSRQLVEMADHGPGAKTQTFSSLSNKSLRFSDEHGAPTSVLFDSIDLGIGAGGSKLYTVGGGTNFSIFSSSATSIGAPQTISISGYAQAIKALWDGRVFVGLAFYNSEAQDNLLIFDAAGNSLGSTTSGPNDGGRRYGLLEISNDGSRAISVHAVPTNPNLSLDLWVLSFYSLP